jgi:sulfate permease, SulP family
VLKRALSSIAWLREYDRRSLRSDLAAGITTGVVIVPQGMAYAMLAGLPPIAGLYAALGATFVYGWLGGSRQLSVGPVAMDSLLTASAVSAIAVSGSERYAQAALMLALMVGGIQLGLGVLRAGFVVNFLSRPVISGFTSAAAIVIATSQLGELARLQLPRSEYVHEVWWAALTNLHEVHGATLALALAALALLRVIPRFEKRVPASLVVMALAILVSHAFNLGSHGMKLVGAVPSGLPGLGWPRSDVGLVRALLPAALAIALVSYTETITTATAFARKHRYEIAPNRELVAVGLANAASGLLAGYPVAGGLSRSAVNDRAGARSQLAGLMTAALIALTLLLLTPLFEALPRAALSAVVLSAVFSLIDFGTPRLLFRVKRADFWLLVLTFAATLTLGITYGIAAGVGASLALFVVRSTRPHYALLGQIPGTQAYLNVNRHRNAEVSPGVLIVRMDAQLYFGNVSFLRDTLKKLEAETHGLLKALVLDASGVNQLDSSALEALEELDRDYTARGIRLLFARVKGPVRDVLDRAGMLTRLRDEQRIFTRTHDAAECARLYVKSSTAPCQAACGDLSTGVDPGCAWLPAPRT